MVGGIRMSQKPSRLKAEINGKDYTIVGLKPQKHMQVVVEIIQAELAELKKLTHKLDDERRAMLLAINAKSEQLELEKEVIQLRDQLQQLQEKLNNESIS